METIPTAKEFCQQRHRNIDPCTSRIEFNEAVMIEFAKMHVEAALKQAAHESQCYNKAKFPGDQNWVVDIESILNSYSLENIK